MPAISSLSHDFHRRTAWRLQVIYLATGQTPPPGLSESEIVAWESELGPQLGRIEGQFSVPWYTVPVEWDFSARRMVPPVPFGDLGAIRGTLTLPRHQGGEFEISLFCKPAYPREPVEWWFDDTTVEELDTLAPISRVLGA